MSTRRPNVPRAPQGARSTSQGPAGGGGAGNAGGKVKSDDVIQAEVLHPDFGSKDGPERGAGASKERASSKDAGAPGTKGGSSSVSSRPKAGEKSSGSGKSPGAAKPSGSGKSSGAAKPAGSNSRLSAAARRTAERDGAKYSVRQPVVSWARPGAAGGVDSSGSATGDGGSGAPGDPVPAKSFSGRLLALAVVLIAMIVLLAPTVQTYVEQRMEINAMQEDIAAKQDERERLQTQLDRWEDPAYIKQQARKRLFLVMPGETQYLVMGADDAQESPKVPASPAGDEDVPWVDALFESIKRSATD